jgi:outer membrane protein OmpA-like peptidoglycan-associated protein
MRVIRHSLLACTLISAFASIALPASANEDAEKLEALQRALRVPGAEAQAEPGKKKVRTRAIVFDNAEPASGSAPAQTGAPAAAMQAVAQNCASINPEAPGMAVDFAIQFTVNSASIAPPSEPLLDQIAKILSLNPSGCIVVEGHTDISGNAEKNTALSRSRAESVVGYLSKSIDKNRMVSVGKGSAQPLKDIDPRNPKNRRVVFKVVI